ncbi:MAG TPA: SAM-dependent methyltransferase [Candidatus Megaira endosymbiont of Hartmannula sinica]|nr:SAM-dependent methyltransferase [Candidatus Megaera endosymbiont of Hartmannula sinica]
MQNNLASLYSDISLLINKTSNKHNIKNGLYIVSTPIGNLKDITIRALEILINSDIIICENNKNSLRLLNSFNITNKKIITYNDHSTEKQRSAILDLVNKKDAIISLISDAGTPLISDPGYKLVNHIYDNQETDNNSTHNSYNIINDRNNIIDISPGACSIIAALSLSGACTDKFTFSGFVPKKTGKLSF